MSICHYLALSLTLLIFAFGSAATEQTPSTQSSLAASKPVETTATPDSITAKVPNFRSSTIVVSVGDGDTIKVRTNSETLTVRLICIDSAETRQVPWGKMATTKLKELLPVGQAVDLRVVDTDRYGRSIAEVFKDGVSVNLQMIKAGMAVVYRQYIDGCAATKDQYLKAEAQAKTQRLGFWQQDEPVMPWDFRQRKKAGSKPPHRFPVTSTTTTSTPKSSIVPSSAKGDYDCSDFSTQAEAQKYLLPGDPYKLDREGDDKACESLP